MKGLLVDGDAGEIEHIKNIVKADSKLFRSRQAAPSAMKTRPGASGGGLRMASVLARGKTSTRRVSDRPRQLTALTIWVPEVIG